LVLRFAGFVIGGRATFRDHYCKRNHRVSDGGLAGMNVGNTRLKKFEEAIEQGELLMLVDIPRERIEAIRNW